MSQVNQIQYRGYPHINHGMKIRDTETTVGPSRNTMVYPRMKYTFLVEFVINENAVNNFNTDLKTHMNSGRFYATLEKVDLPKFTLEVETIRSYNKNVKIPITQKQEPCNMILQDDNSSLASALILENQSFYMYGGNIGEELSDAADMKPEYFRQGNNLTGANVRANQSSRPSIGLTSRKASERHFFDEIIIYDLGSDPDSVNVYHYVNPIITTATFDSLDYKDGDTYNKIDITFEYEYQYFKVGNSANEIIDVYESRLGISSPTTFEEVGGNISGGEGTTTNISEIYRGTDANGNTVLLNSVDSNFIFEPVTVTNRPIYNDLTFNSGTPLRLGIPTENNTYLIIDNDSINNDPSINSALNNLLRQMQNGGSGSF